MLTFQLRDEHGEPVYRANGTEPVSVTICSSRDAARFGKLPRGPKVWFEKSATPRAMRKGRRATAAELNRLADHLVSWSGFWYDGRPIACSRSVACGVMTAAPHFRRQLEHSIRDLELSGVL